MMKSCAMYLMIRTSVMARGWKSNKLNWLLSW